MNKKTKLRFEDLPQKYEALCRLLLPRPIHHPSEYAIVAEVIEAMSSRKDEFSGDQTDYFDLLSWLIEEYDAMHLKRPRITALEMIKRLMEKRNMTPADLSRLLGGNRSVTASVLRGERGLTLRHVKVLVREFGVSADNFLG
jgi:HTH-type transcriptional regulator / antitoxin HigA